MPQQERMPGTARVNCRMRGTLDAEKHNYKMEKDG